MDTPQVDIPAALRKVQRDVDERILRPPGEGKGAGAKLVAIVLLVGSVASLGWDIRSVVRIPRQARDTPAAAQPKSRTKVAFWFLVLPAVASVLLWNHYPMLRGFLLTFQEYRLGGDAKWMDLANFVEGAWSARFSGTRSGTASSLSCSTSVSVSSRRSRWRSCSTKSRAVNISFAPSSSCPRSRAAWSSCYCGWCSTNRPPTAPSITSSSRSWTGGTE
jgi:hypothetical protein